MVALTKKTEYALMALASLARAGDARVSARELAGRNGLRVPLLMNVLKQLSQAGLLASVRGANGGYALIVPPETLSLARVIEVIEGPFRLVRCACADEDGPERGAAATEDCEYLPTCGIRGPMLRVHERVQEMLETVTIADVAFDSQDTPAAAGSLRVLA